MPIQIIRRKRIGMGIDPNTNITVHEEYAFQYLDLCTDTWLDTGFRFDWWYGPKGIKRERHYSAKPPFDDVFQPEPAGWGVDLPVGYVSEPNPAGSLDYHSPVRTKAMRWGPFTGSPPWWQ